MRSRNTDPTLTAQRRDGGVDFDIRSGGSGVSFRVTPEQAFRMARDLALAALITVQARELHVGDKWYREGELFTVTDVVEEDDGRMFVAVETEDDGESYRRVSPSSLVRVIR